MTPLALLSVLLCQSEGVQPKYAAAPSAREKVATEMRLGVKIEGSDQLANYIRSMHPFLSMNDLLVRAEGTRQLLAGRKVKVEHDESRVTMKYDDEDHEYDYKRGTPPPPPSEKMKQMVWYLAAGGKNYTLSPEGEYRSEDANQDHNGEAMDLFTLGITRMPDKPVKEGETYERAWKGSRSEKKKSGVFAFKQVVKVEKIEDRGGKKVAVLSSDLTGTLEGPKDPSAEDSWTKAEGKTKIWIEVETGRVLSSEGGGKVTAYFKNTAENGQKQELTLTFSASGKLEVK